LNGAVISTINNFGVLAGINTSLIAQLETALVDLQAGHSAAACSKLQGFLNEVNAQRGRRFRWNWLMD